MKRISLWALWLCATCVCAQEAIVPAPAAPDYEDCLKQKPALQTLESKLQDGEQTLTLADISHRAMLFIEACGGGGAGSGSTSYGAEGVGGGGGSAALVRIVLRCGEPLGAWAGSKNRLLDCRNPVTVKVPGRASSGQSGGGLHMVMGGEGVLISKGGEGGRVRGFVGGRIDLGGGAGYRNGGYGYYRDEVEDFPTAGANSETFTGGAPGPAGGGGGGGASDVGNGGNGGGADQPGGDGGLCAGGGAAGRRFRGEPTAGRGGPGYARIVALDINEVANCGRAALLKNLQFEVSRMVQDELKKAATPPTAAPAPAASVHK